MTSVAVLGLGLIGGSVALSVLEHFASSKQDVVVTGWDPDAPTCQAAEQAGIVIAPTLGSAVHGADIVFLCGPLKTLKATAKQIAPHLAPATIVTDVGSVKGVVRSAMAQAGIVEQYVGAHPMAGTECAGFSSANPDLLQGATWALTLDEDTDQGSFLGLAQFLTTVLGARLIILTDQVHDGAAALISHVPHVLAHALLGVAATSDYQVVAKRLAAGSFRDGTRVARLNPDRNRAMVEDNTEAVARALEQVVADLTALIGNLKAHEPAPQFFNRSQLWPAENLDGVWTTTIAAGNWRTELLSLGQSGSLITAIHRQKRSDHTFSVTVVGQQL